MSKNIALLCLSLLSTAALTTPAAHGGTSEPSDQTFFSAPAPAKDLGEEVMKPMAALFQGIATDVSDSTKNTSNIQALTKLSELIDIALVTVPDTKAYVAEVSLVGIENASVKYKGLLNVLKVVTIEMAQYLKLAKSQACGSPCAASLKQMQQLQSVAHTTFKDP